MKRITYQLMTMVNYGTEEEPLSEPTFSECSIDCADENFEVNYLLAQSEAYEGKVEVEDIPDEPEPSVEDTTLELLADHEERICMIELMTM